MKTLSFLQKITQGKRSLIITCLESCLDIEQHMDGSVFRYTALGNIINLNDEYQMQNIRNFVEFKKCSTIILAGHTDCRVLSSILLHPIPAQSPLNFAKVNLTEIFSGNHCSLLHDGARETILIEQNIISQCRALLGYAPFKEKLSEGKLEIIGLLLDPNGKNKQLFSHGISYNNLISMN